MFALIGPLASLLGFEAEALKERLQRQAIVFALVGVFAMIAVAFLLVAINSALTLSFGPVVAPLLLAAGALFIAAVIFLVGYMRDSAETRRETEKKRSAESTALITTAALTALPFLLQSPLLKRVGIPLGGALAAAFFLSRSKTRPEP